MEGLKDGLRNMFKKDDSKILEECDSFKKRGNRCFSEADYHGAIEAYSKGIKLVESSSPKIQGNGRIQEWNRYLAQLHGNCSECWFKLSEHRKGLEDAKKNVHYQPDWFKGHYRMARSYKELDKLKKAAMAYVKAYNRLLTSDGEDMHTKILKELIETSFITESEDDSLLAELTNVPTTLRAQVIKSYIENKEWNIVAFIVTKMWKLTDNNLWEPNLKSYSKLKVNLELFCDKDLLSQHWWVPKLMHHFLVFKSDHRRLKFHPGDTYFHATITIVVQSQRPARQTQEDVNNVHNDSLVDSHDGSNAGVDHDGGGNAGVDHDGSNADVDKDSGGNADVDHDSSCNPDATELLHYVVENIVIPKGDLNIEDDKGNTVLHHLATFDTYPSSVLSYILSKGVNCLKVNKDSKTVLELSKQPDKRSLLLRGVIAQHVAEIDKHKKVKDLKDKKKLKEKNVQALTSLLTHHNNPVIPEELLKISAVSCKDLLTSLADAGKWLVLKELVTKFKQTKGETALPTFAKEMSLKEVVQSQELTESQKIDVVRLLVSHEASLDSPDPIKASIHNEEWELTMELLDLGVNPEGVTLTPGDTPYHAALDLALNKLNGDFSMLEKLKAFQDKKKSLNKNVTVTDKDGNTLLHMAAQAPSYPHGLRAGQLLSTWGIPTDIRNNEDKMAVDYLTDLDDERHQYIQVTTKSKSKKKSNSKKATEDATQKTDQQLLERENLEARISSFLAKMPEATGFLNLELVDENLKDYDDENTKEKNPIDNGLGTSESNGGTGEDLDQASDELSWVDQMDIDPKDFDKLEWDIECTESVWRTLINKRLATVDVGSQKLSWRNLVLMKLRQLGSGDWKKQVALDHLPETLRLYRVPLTSDAFILWERAIAFSPRLSDLRERSGSHDSQESAIKEGRVYAEHIRVWEVGLKTSNLEAAIARIVQSHQRGKQCVVKKFLTSQNPKQLNQSEKILPKLYSELTDLQEVDEAQRGQVIQLTPPASLHENEFTILKLYTLSSQMVEAILNDGDSKVDFPFRVTEIEHTFINLKPEAPLLLLGRSGTGKTTCCLYRLFQEFMEYWKEATALGRCLIPRLEITDERNADVSEVNNLESDGSESSEDEMDYNYEHLQQIFVTKNPVLCQEVENNFIKLCQTPKWLCDHVAQRAEDIPNQLQEVEDNSFPLFLTSRHLLLILDASVDGEAFFSRDEDLGMKLYVPGWEPQEDIFNIGQPLHRINPRGFQHARAQRQPDPRRESTYEFFAHKIWPKIKKESDFHPSLVWTEIVSFIKGSYEALECPEGYLNKDQYISIGKKRAPNFDSDRPLIYDIFLRYNKYLKDKNLFDEADVVFHIYGRLKNTSGNIYWSPHNIYIDETQDFSQAELALLVSLCRFPNQMFLAGDTAQSIMRGVSFRFADLKSIFFHRTHQKLAGQTQVKKPDKIRQLRHNYRSHTGILALASAILDIILELFPETIDKLEKDQGMFDGPNPVIIETCKPEDLALLLKGNTRDTTPIEFGAHQAILVVNDEAKNNLPRQLRDGIVLTIYESKGLEFDDILIYNFFKYSQASKEWRVVTTFLNELVEKLKKPKNHESRTESLVVLNEDVLQQPGRPRPLTFDKHLHKLLDTDLKQLYTAVTRARVNVWIFDEDAEKRDPMFEYFKALNLVKILGAEDTNNDNEGKGFMETSTPEQWKQAGDKHMEQKKYKLAATCYKKANQTNLEKLAKAFITSEEAALEANSSAKKGKLLYLKAGAQFLYCKAMEQAVRCFQNAQAYKYAALTLEKLGKFEDASREYDQVPDLNSSTRCLEQVGQYQQAIHKRVQNNQFTEAVDCLHRYQNLVKTFEVKCQALPESLLKNKPSGDQSEDNLWLKLAEFQYKEGKIADGHQTLARVTDRLKKIDLLKKMTFWKEAAVLLHDEGTEEERREAVQLMMRSGHLTTALEYAKLGFFKKLRGAIHISMALGPDELEIKKHLNAAKNIYSELGDRCGQGLASLLLGQHAKDQKLLNEAYKLFDDSTSPHLPGQLESFAAIIEVSSSNALLTLENCSLFVRKIIDSGLEFIQILTGRKEQWQSYLEFYGLELDGTRQKLTWYPNEQPLFKKIYTSDGHAMCYTVDVKEVVQVLTKYTVEKIQKLTKTFRRRLLQLTEQAGQQTTHRSQHTHQSNKEKDREVVLNLLILNVELDNNLYLATEKLERSGMADIKKILLDEFSWKSVDSLLQFLAPLRLYLDVDIGQVLTDSAIVQNSKETLTQVERYFRLRWVNVNTPIVARELERSTCWVIIAHFWSSFLQLNLDVQKEVTQFEIQINQKLKNNVPENLASLGLYQSKDEPDGPTQIHFAGSLFVQSFNEICSAGDMHKSTNLFIETMNLICQSGQGMRLSSSELEHIVFWMEFHFCVSIFTLANASFHEVNRKQAFYLPKSLLAKVNMVNAFIQQIDPLYSGVTVQQAVSSMQQFYSDDDLKVVPNKLAKILLGTQKSSFSLISHVQPLYKGGRFEKVLAERILILTLVTLVNIPKKIVNKSYEGRIMKGLHKVEYKAVSPHLATLIGQVLQGQGYPDVAISLMYYFSVENLDELMYCMWRPDSNNPLVVHQLDLSRFPNLPFFNHSKAKLGKDEKKHTTAETSTDISTKR